MAEVKTKPTNLSVSVFINAIPHESRRADAHKLLAIFKKITKAKPVMWGTSIVGFGSYHYTSDRSSQEADWPVVAFSPRSTGLVVYIMPGFTSYVTLLKKLGTYKTSVSCLYIKKMSDINEAVLATLIAKSVKDMKKKHVTKNI